MLSKKKRLADFKLYAVTDVKADDTAVVRQAEQALRGGADIIQLRSKVLTDGALYRLGKQLHRLTHKYKKLFFVNDRPDLCCAVDADGVHIGQDDLSVPVVRKIVGRMRLIGKSTHSVAQARATLREDVDYIGFGPVFGTPTKPDYMPTGVEPIAAVMRMARKPVVCIGGISLKTIDMVIAAGARRVAVVRALFAAPDVRAAAAALRERLEHNT